MTKSLRYKLKKKSQKEYKIFKKTLARKISKEMISKKAVFVFGCQRSGTRVPMEVMDYSPDIITYREGEPEAFNKVLLKELKELKELIEKSPFEIVAFKPICESHRAGELLDSFNDAKGLWIFRNYKDVINSRARKWENGLNNLTHIASENAELAGWRMGGLNRAKIDLVKELFSKELSSADGHALMYYLRNSLFFDLELNKRKNILLIKYEDLVNYPEEHFKKIFRFIDCSYKNKYTASIFKSSVGKDSFQHINQEIEELCKNIETKLSEHYNQQDLIIMDN